MPWINVNDKEVWKEDEVFKVGEHVIVVSNDTRTGVVVERIPSGINPTSVQLETYWKVDVGNKLFWTLSNGKPPRFDRFVVKIDNTNDYFIFPANPAMFELGILYGRNFTVQRKDMKNVDTYTMLNVDWPKLENGKEDTWWNRLILLRDSYYCVEKHAADCMIIDEGSYKMLLEELDNHPTDALWFQNCCTIVVVPRIGKSEVHFYKALSIN